MTKEIQLADDAPITPAQANILLQQTPPEAIKLRQGKGGKTFRYVEHAWVTEQLNEAFGWAWSWEIVDWKIMPESEPSEVMVLGKLTVHGRNGASLVKTQFGSSDVKRDKQGNVLSVGDDLKAASSDALKKTASLLGLALDLYRSDDEGTANGKAAKGQGKQTGNVGDDPATRFWVKCREHGVDTEQGRDILQEHGGSFDDAYKALVFQFEESGA